MLPFEFFAPITVFEKAGAPEGQRRRIAGVVSTEVKDKQKETLLQRGLDFGPFLTEGWYNDNHLKGTTDVLGYPDSVQKFRKGDRLPDGEVAQHNGTWAEGYLLDTPKASQVWDLAQALKKAGSDRRLGFSVEGNVIERAGPDGKTIAKAVVRNVAITNCPVGFGTRMEALAKSMDEVEKGMTAGTSSAPPATTGPATGEGAGRVLTLQHLEGAEEEDEPKNVAEAVDARRVEKSVALSIIQHRLGCGLDHAERAYSALLNLKQHGML